MTMTTINAIVNAIAIGMDFDTVVKTVKGFTNDFTVTVPTDDMFGFIFVGDTFGNSADISFDTDDKVDAVDVSTLDDFD